METKRLYLYINNNYQELTEKLPEKPKNKTRLVFISDTHEKHEFIDNIPKADILIHSGDILCQGRKYSDSVSLKKYQDFNEWIGKLDCSYKLVIGGNHDHYLDKIGLVESRKIFTNCNYLCNEFISLKGINFFASPFNIGNSKNNAFQSKYILDDLEKNTVNNTFDFLITHGPLDENFFSNKKIKYHIWGHLHNYYGTYTVKSNNQSIKSICACSLNDYYELSNGPIVMDL
jgi:predicted MPP superfamily phosphohydrolase